MTTKNNQKNNQEHKQDSHAGVMVAGIAAVAAAAAGAYFLYGTKEGAARRKNIKGWALKMKGEVLEHMEDMKDMSEEAYTKMIDTIASTYKGVKNVDATELAIVAGDLKKHWKNIKKHLADPKMAKKMSARVIKEVKKTGKKSSK